jgi:hypothetical protein
MSIWQFQENLMKTHAVTAVERPITVPTVDFAAIKQRQQATWASGDFAIIGTTLQIVGESLAEAAELERRNMGGPSALVVPGEYLEIVITKAGRP